MYHQRMQQNECGECGMSEKNQRRKGRLRKWFGFGGETEVANTLNSSAEINVCDKFLSVAEIKLYKVLKNMVSGRLEIFPKVSPTDVFSIPSSFSNEHQQEMYQSYIDFLLCDSETFKPVLAIKLEDGPTTEEISVNNDEILGLVISESDLPLVTVQTQEAYQIPDLARLFREAIENSFSDNEGGDKN
jgi:hypothetical protein